MIIIYESSDSEDDSNSDLFDIYRSYSVTLSSYKRFNYSFND